MFCGLTESSNDDIMMTHPRSTKAPDPRTCRFNAAVLGEKVPCDENLCDSAALAMKEMVYKALAASWRTTSEAPGRLPAGTIPWCPSVRSWFAPMTKDNVKVGLINPPS